MAAKVFLWVVSAAMCVAYVLGNSSGPPARDSTCLNMIPDSSAPHILQEGNGTYYLTVDGIGDAMDGYFTFTPGTLYTGNIRSDNGETIAGFLVQAVDPSDSVIGSFGTDQRQMHLACGAVTSGRIPDAATLVHNQVNTGVVISFSWTAPSSGNLVDFRFTIVRSRSEYFGPLSAASPDGLISATTMLPTDTMAPTSNPRPETNVSAAVTRGEDNNNMNQAVTDASAVTKPVNLGVFTAMVAGLLSTVF